MSAAPPPIPPPDDPNLDLGFGSVVARESRKRFLNRDGTFNVRREGLGSWEALSFYNYFLTMSWPHFLAWVSGAYIVLNAVFALAFIAGIMFSRFARPRAEIIFSRSAVVAPYQDGRALMFRIVNKKRNEIVEMEAKVLLARRKRGGKGANDREFIPLKLERDRVVF